LRKASRASGGSVGHVLCNQASASAALRARIERNCTQRSASVPAFQRSSDGSGGWIRSAHAGLQRASHVAVVPSTLE
jgi:hypothetical protein